MDDFFSLIGRPNLSAAFAALAGLHLGLSWKVLSCLKNQRRVLFAFVKQSRASSAFNSAQSGPGTWAVKMGGELVRAKASN